jgi:hypothetical protein
MTGRPNQSEQWDLFGERGTGRSNIVPESVEVDPKALDDQELIEQLPKATLSNIHALCTQIVERDLGDGAVPGLVALWSRFKGFGTTSPLPEQRLALLTLGETGTPDAQNEIRKILAAPGMPDSLLPVALQAAVTAKLSLPLRYITPWLEHKVPLVRALAFSLIQTAIPPLYLLETGLSDPDPSVRRAALVTAGNLGHHIAKAGLLGEFRKSPSSQIIRALLAIADEEIIIKMGRFAMEKRNFQKIIVEELVALENPRASKIAHRIKKQMDQP